VDYDAEIRSLKGAVAKQNVKIEVLEGMILRAVQMRVESPPAPTAAPAKAPASRTEQLRGKYANHGRPWTTEDRTALCEVVRDREFYADNLPDRFGRSLGALRSEVYRLRRSNVITDVDLDLAGVTGYKEWLGRQSG
jgi:hypothetical protein